MSDEMNMIAVFGGHLYEEKEYSFLEALSKVGEEQGFTVAGFTFSKESMLQDDVAGAELRLLTLASALPIKSIVLLFESVDNDLLIDGVIELGHRLNVPVFCTGGTHDGCINLTLNYKSAFREVVRHIVEHHGLKRVYMVAGIEGNSYSDERIEAYREVLEENGIPYDPDKVGYGDFWDRPARVVVNRFLDGDELPEAIVCANDTMAITACDVIRERGLRVPEDIIVAGFDSIMSSLLNDPSITTIGPDFAREAHLISHNTFNRDEDAEEFEIGSMIRYGSSCGCGKTIEVNRMVSTINESFYDINWHVIYMNDLLSRATELSSMSELSDAVAEKTATWNAHFRFVALLSEFVNDTGDETPDSYTEFFRCENGSTSGIRDVFDHNTFLPGLERLKEEGIHFLITQLLYSGGITYGYAVTGYDKYVMRDVRRTDEFGRFLSTAIHMVVTNRKLRTLNQTLREANIEIERQSVIDYLTGIYNRRGFYMELERVIGIEENQGRMLTLFSIDMDGLKSINDNYGHKDGDFAIRVLAGAIQHFASRNGFAARYGGDEFACALITDQEIHLDADLVRSRLQGTLQSQASVREKPYSISASIGSVISPITAEMNIATIETMIREADAIMYEDKLSRKKNRVS